MSVTITTNHHWRDFAYRADVPAAVLADRFDWLSEDDGYDGFFCYRGWWYHNSEFTATCLPGRDADAGPLAGWDGYISDSYFSGVVIKVSRDGERYMVGTFIS